MRGSDDQVGEPVAIDIPGSGDRNAAMVPGCHTIEAARYFIGKDVPVWDIADKFGDTNVLVTNMDQGRDLAKCLGGNGVALMRGHGFASAARSLIEVVRMSVYLPRNARALMRAKMLSKA